MALPSLIVTGSSGFIGRHLLDALKERHRIFGLARRSQVRCGAPVHDNIIWHQVDIGERGPLTAAFRSIREAGGADTVIHLAAHYDFTGDDNPEYWRTNVDGLRNVLEECVDLGVKRFVFASSVAACQFPLPGGALNEESPPDGEHIYALTKRLGEEMLAEYDGLLRTVIVRFAALFSDWCEYPPLYFFLETWLGQAWNARILGGKGLSAVPYLHVRDATRFLSLLVNRLDRFGQREVLQCSPSGAIGHLELFDLANLASRGYRRKPVLMPHLLCRLGVWGRDLSGRLLGDRPFERPWMVRYIDRALTVDASRTHERLGWAPRDRLLVERRIPFMVEHMKTDPLEWHRRNRAALKEVHLRSNLRIYRLLEKHQDWIGRELIKRLRAPEAARFFPSYQRVSGDIMEWRGTVIIRHLMNSVRTRDKGIFMAYCRDLAQRRFGEGFLAEEVCSAVEILGSICLRRLLDDPEGQGLDHDLDDHITTTVRFGCDQILETFEELLGDEKVVSGGTSTPTLTAVGSKPERTGDG